MASARSAIAFVRWIPTAPMIIAMTSATPAEASRLFRMPKERKTVSSRRAGAVDGCSATGAVRLCPSDHRSTPGLPETRRLAGCSRLHPVAPQQGGKPAALDQGAAAADRPTVGGLLDAVDLIPVLAVIPHRIGPV